MTGTSPRALNKQAKERRILEAALSVFSDQGYSGASMDAIAARAEVSKPTLYQYFGTKEQLFSAIMLQRRDRMLDAFAHPSPEGMVRDLHSFAWDYAATVMSPDFLSLARLIIAEAQRFPEIGRAYQSSGPDRLLAGIMEYLTRQRAEGRLKFDDAELAAQDLWALILSAPRNQALHVPDPLPTRAQIARYLNNGLRVFLAAYSTAPDQDHATLSRLLAGRPPETDTP